MKKFLPSVCAAAILGLGAVSCDENSNIGESVVNDRISIIIDSLSTIKASSTESNSTIQSRTLTQLLGIIESDDFGKMSSDVVMQFMPANELDTAGIAVDDIDSLKLVMYMNKGAYVGDSVIPMGLNIYELNKTLPSPIYSDFDPASYYNPNDLLTSANYNVAPFGVSDSLEALDYRTIDVMLPVALAKRLYKTYRENPSTFSTPEKFNNVFKGLYIKNTFGSGRMVHVAQTVMRLYFRKHAKVEKDGVMRDTIYKGTANYFAVTPEVVTNNNINLDIASKIRERIDKGEKIILAPTGVDVSFEFPVKDIIDKYKAECGPLSVVNSVTMSIPADPIDNTFGINPPSDVLLILSKDKDKFFAENSLTDNVTSFTATYNSATNSYYFADVRGYVMKMLEKENLTPEDYTFTITPVTINYEQLSQSSYYYYTGATSSIVSSIVPYVAQPCMAQIHFKDAKIELTYSKLSTSF